MLWTPHATVAAIVMRDNKFLFVEETVNGQRVINQPAGHVEDNETLKEATIRETLEETGWHVEPQYLTGIYTYKAPHNGITYHRFCYAANALKFDENYPIDPDITCSHWLSRQELNTHLIQPRTPLVLKCVEDFLEGARYPLDLVYEHPFDT